MKFIKPEALALTDLGLANLEPNRVTLLDVRSPEEFATGHIEGALNLPLNELEQRLEQVPKDQPIVTYCVMKHPGDSRGERAAKLLEERGFKAGVLDGGLPAWQTAQNKAKSK
jgi:rhodanese-related sulfurtransferase